MKYYVIVAKNFDVLFQYYELFIISHQARQDEPTKRKGTYLPFLEATYYFIDNFDCTPKLI